MIRFAAIILMTALAACEHGIDPLVEEIIDDAPGSVSWKDIQVASVTVCGLTTQGQAYCWGGRLGGNGSERFVKAAAGALRFESIAVGGSLGGGFNAATAACGITPSKTLHCWGNMASGSLGDGTTSISETPVLVDLPRPVAAVSVGAAHACALDDAGAAYCWGIGGPRLGGGVELGLALAKTPRPVLTSLRFTSISAGATQSCAIAQSGEAYCWGSDYGTLGIGVRDTACTTSPSCHWAYTPELVEGGRLWKEISAGSGATCGVTTANRGYCWGEVAPSGTLSKPRGMLGSGSYSSSKSPVAVVGGHLFQSIVSGGGPHSCGVLTNNDLLCWGEGSLGVMLPNATRHTPSRVLGRLQFRSVSPGEYAICGVTVNNNAYCWGNATMIGTGIPSGIEPFPKRVGNPVP